MKAFIKNHILQLSILLNIALLLAVSKVALFDSRSNTETSPTFSLLPSAKTSTPSAEPKAEDVAEKEEPQTPQNPAQFPQPPQPTNPPTTEPTAPLIDPLTEGGPSEAVKDEEENNSFWPTEPEKHDTYPIIIKVSDSLGNFTTGSTGNGIPFFVTWPDPKPMVKIDQTIVITIEAEDPNSDPLQYKFKNNLNQTVQDWSNSNTFTWAVGQETGGNPFITPMIRDNDGSFRYGDVDDSTVLYYLLK